MQADKEGPGLKEAGRRLLLLRRQGAGAPGGGPVGQWAAAAGSEGAAEAATEGTEGAEPCNACRTGVVEGPPGGAPLPPRSAVPGLAETGSMCSYYVGGSCWLAGRV